MDYFGEFFVLISAYITVLSSQNVFVVGDDERFTSEFEFSKPISKVYDYTTESLQKTKNALLDLKNNNILRDKNTHSLVTENVKSLLDDIMKNSFLNKSDSMSANLEPEQVSTISSDIEQPGRPRSNILNVLPRNTRDLIPGPESVSNSTDIAISNSTVVTLKENITSLNTPIDGENRTSFVPVLGNGFTNGTIAVANEANITSTTSLPSFLKHPKEKGGKPKPEMNPKQFKKPSNNFKNKPNVITKNNVSIETIKSENITEYVTDEPPFNDNVTADNVTNIVSWINSTNKYDSNNETTSSLQTLPELEGLQPLTIILIGVGIVALITIITAIGMFSVVLYRRYHWNKPQTFSDKCSNADSTGYIDDSTLKENSEEMYSLDNDSFLNSLEAMTIQNYWADSIRHTKL